MRRRQVLRYLTGTATVALAGCQSASDQKQTDTPSPTATDRRSDTATETPAKREIPTTGPPADGAEAFDEQVPALMREWDIPGASVAVADQGRLSFVRGYGVADRDTGTVVTPGALFRVGSLSKPVTAVATLELAEQGLLSLDDRAFEILSQLVPADGPADDRVMEITVRQLLRHTGGWSVTSLGYDPMFRPVEVAEAMGTEPPASPETVVRYMMDKQLGFDPGNGWEYSNFGYCVLGRVIAEVTGRSYESAVQQRVLGPVGATRMQIGATRRANLLDDEVYYHGTQRVESPYPEVGEVPRPYGATTLRMVDAPGGWVGSTVDLARFVQTLDGRGDMPAVLSSDTIATMTERPDISQWQGTDQFYASGWFVSVGRGAPSLWHNGSLPGSFGFVFHDSDQNRTLAALFNARPQQFQQFNRSAQQTLLRAMQATQNWPDRNLFDEYR